MRRLVAVSGFFLALACSSGTAPVPSAGSSGSVEDAFTSAASESGVPRDLLVAIARVEDGLTMPKTRDVDLASNVPVAGPLELRRGKLDTLARGARLLGVSETDIRRDADLGLRAGALVLAELGRNTSAGVDLASWEPALEELSGFADTPHRADYAKRVFSALEIGGTYDARDGERVALRPHLEVHAAASVVVISPEQTFGTLPEYGGAQVFPTSCTNKCDTTRGGASIDYVVIHDTEGGWNASVATLQNDPAKSVHYIVGTDGTVGQFVPESYTAWHDGNYYYNQRSVGIEHVGYYQQTYPEAEYAASAKLVSYLTGKYSIAKDRQHVFGHDQVPNGSVLSQSAPTCQSSPATCETGTSYGGASNHRDPGDWEWCTYMPRFGGTCKCDDVWNLWNCSSSGTQAFRCVNGNVELKDCTAGCVTQPVGTDDQCNVAEVDGGSLPDASAPPTSHGKETLSPVGAANEAPQQGSSSSGCATSAAPRSGTSAWLLALGALVIATRRRRR